MDDLLDLVDIALDELETHGLHEQQLDVILIYLAVSSDAVEFQRPVVLIDSEQQLQE